MKRVCRLLPLLVLAACASHERLTTVDTRAESVGHQRLPAQPAGAGGGQVQPYVLAASEGYRMPQLHVAPDPVLGESDPRRELAPTTICLQVVVSAEGTVQRSLPLTDRAECVAGTAAENAPLLRAAQQAVAQWRYAAAAVCHFAAGQVRGSGGGCEGAERIEAVPVSLLYAFTFEIVHGQAVVRKRKGDGSGGVR